MVSFSPSSCCLVSSFPPTITRAVLVHSPLHCLSTSLSLLSIRNPQHSPAWVVMQELTVPPECVDVNLHPTKEEVAVLHLPAITEALCAALRAHLLAHPPT